MPREPIVLEVLLSKEGGRKFLTLTLRTPRRNLQRRAKLERGHRLSARIANVASNLLGRLPKKPYALRIEGKGISPVIENEVLEALSDFLERRDIAFEQRRPPPPPPSPGPVSLGREAQGPYKVAYTDGSSIGNPGPAGWAYIYGREVRSGSYYRKSSNTMELKALLELLRDAPQGDALEVRTDSKFLIAAISGRWATREPHIIELQEAIHRTIEARNLAVRLVKVGSKKTEGNRKADRAARKAARERLAELPHRPCPACGRGVLIPRPTRDGRVFLSCHQFPECRGAANLSRQTSERVLRLWEREPPLT